MIKRHKRHLLGFECDGYTSGEAACAENCTSLGLSCNCIANLNAAFVKYHECYKDGWEFTFVGCCHDQNDFCSKCKNPNRSFTTSKCKSNRVITAASIELHQSEVHENSSNPVDNNGSHHQYMVKEDLYDDTSAFTTRFNVTALVPSVQRLYVDLWDTIELALLGYYDADETETIARNLFIQHPTQHSEYPVPAIMRILRTSVLPELAEYLYFVVGFKPLAVRGIYNRLGEAAARRRRRRNDGGVMGPVLSRGLGGVRLGFESPHQQHQHQSGIGSMASSTENSACRNDVRSSLDVIPASRESMSGAQHPQTISTTTTLEEINSLRDAATTMSAWKLACFLRQRGVGCLRCGICDCIDLMGDDFEEDYCGGANDGMEERDVEEDEPHGMDATNTSTHNSRRPSAFLREFQKQVGGGDAWMTPCQCPELVHRQCLERKLKLIPKYEYWEHVKLHFRRVHALLSTPFAEDKRNVRGGTVHPKQVSSSGLDQTFSLTSPISHANLSRIEHIAPRVWISYDDTIPVRRRWHRHADGHVEALEEEDAVIAVDNLGRFRSSAAMCQTCGGKFLRTVRLPRSKWEVLAASLSDPIALIRAASTFTHFILSCTFIAACEGICTDDSCGSHRILFSTSLGFLKWPTTGLNGFALAWWQLQQCCMLHIFFSGRFAAIVDRLWMGPISLFYCRLYFYFIVTSAILATSFIPMVSRTIRINFLEPFIPHWILKTLQPLFDILGLLNLFQYAIVSTTVICIFWRTNYRIFTVADGKEAAVILRRREELMRYMQSVREGRGHAVQNDNEGRHAAAQHADFVANNALPLQRIVGVGDGDSNAANHPIYHGPW